MTDTKALARILPATEALAPLAPEIALPAIAAQKGTVIAHEILTGDIAVIRVAYPRGTKKKPLPPLEVEYHINLAAIGIGAFFAALGALGLAVAWNGFQTLGGGLTGLSESRPGKMGSGGSTPSILDSGIAILKHLFGLP